MIPTRQNKKAASSQLRDFDYEGVLNRIHQEDSKFKGRRSQYERDPFTKYQNFMYKRALYGLSVYTSEETRLMHWEKKRRIIKVHKKAQTLLNLLKQEVTIMLSNQLLKHFCKMCRADSPLKRGINLLIEEYSSTDEGIDNPFTLRELGITKTQVIELFIREGVLPKDFYDQRDDPHESQKIIRLRKPVDSLV